MAEFKFLHNNFYLGDGGKTPHELESLHEKMGCICYENKAMGIYFIVDPDGYWLEILPKD